MIWIWLTFGESSSGKTKETRVFVLKEDFFSLTQSRSCVHIVLGPLRFTKCEPDPTGCATSYKQASSKRKKRPLMREKQNLLSEGGLFAYDTESLY